MSQDRQQERAASASSGTARRFFADRSCISHERLRRLVKPHRQKFDPRDPRNKLPNGKLSERGVEACYRLFDQGKTPYTVGHEMLIAFGSAMHRFKVWQKAGGVNRKKQKLD
jgi:hypothetical protein